MNSEETLKTLCSNCERHLSLSKQACPFRSISNDYCEEYENIKRDLKVLEIFKKYLFISIKDRPCFDETYAIGLKEDKDDEWDYTIICVNKEENDLLKEYFKDDTPRT